MISLPGPKTINTGNRIEHLTFVWIYGRAQAGGSALRLPVGNLLSVTGDL